MVTPVQQLVKKDVTFVYHDRDVELVRFLVFSLEGQNYSTFLRHRDVILRPDQPIMDWVEKSMWNSRVIVAIMSDSFIRCGGLLDLEIAMVTAAQSQDKLVIIVICQGGEHPGLLAGARTVAFNGDFDRLKGDLLKIIQEHISASQTSRERVPGSQPIPGSSPTRQRQWDISVLEEDVLCHIQLGVITTLRSADITDKLRYIVRSSRDRSAFTFCGTAIMNAATLTLALLLLGLVLSSLGYPLFDVHLVHLIFLVFPLFKGLYCFQLIAKYRYKIVAMYKCCRSGRESLVPDIIDTLVRTANTPYRSVRSCVITVLAGEIAIWAVIVNISLAQGHNINGITQLMEMYPFTVLPFSVFLFHTCYVAAHLLFYHDPTIRTLIRNQRFYFAEIMEDPDFHKHHKTLESYLSRLHL
ncbi:uncharacterized protein [Branchiostoma lanceolatum]|uniref:uncharacterized protein n=1 Tax=Branchiostoma lanceolatum TaxID=7740 RepID=UPI003453DC1F